MKSPLIAILGFTKLIREQYDDMPNKKLEAFLKTIKDSGEQLESQVLEFLEYARQTTDKIKLKLEYVDLPNIVNQLVLRYQQQSAGKKITIRKEYDISGPIKIDKNQILRVFENLLGNAIKFIFRHGEIVISIKETSREAVIQFIDNGPGIDTDDLPYVFDAFHQSESSNKGHGLGLAAVKAIVQEHRGRVSVRSNPEEKTVFTVRIPKRK